MTFDMDAIKDLFEKYQTARDAEDVVRKAILAAMESGTTDIRTLSELSARLKDAHNKTTDIWNQIQEYRFDA